MATIDSAGFTDVGRKRKGNEDSFFFDDDLRLYVVADGMGGHAAGEVASRIVVDTMRDFVRQFTDNPAGAAQLPRTDQGLSSETNLLLNAVHLSNRAVHQKAQTNVKYKGMGSTVSAVLFADGQLSVVNVGDSPIYLIRNDSVEVVSTPHTMMDEYREMATTAARKVGNHLRHVLTRAMGLHEKVQPDARDIALSGGEIVVICSDGLSDKVTAEEVQEVVTRQTPDRAVTSLVDMANERGGEDNITVIVAKWGEEKPGRRPGAGLSGQKADAPGASRFAVDYDTEDTSHRTYVSEIRTDGVFLQTKEAVAVGETIQLTFTPKQGGEPVMLSGRVASRSSDGIDVRFEGLTPAQRQWLDTVARS